MHCPRLALTSLCLVAIVPAIAAQTGVAPDVLKSQINQKMP